jgi:hypothetical protein
LCCTHSPHSPIPSHHSVVGAPAFSDEEEEEEEVVVAGPVSVLGPGKKKKGALAAAKARDAKDRKVAKASEEKVGALAEEMRQADIAAAGGAGGGEGGGVLGAAAKAADSISVIKVNKKADAEEAAHLIAANFKGGRTPNSVVHFVNALLKDMSSHLKADDLNNINKVLSKLKTAAVKKERAQSVKAKQKGALKMTMDNNFDGLADDMGGGDGYDDNYDDFM